MGFGWKALGFDWDLLKYIFSYYLILRVDV